MPFLDWFRFDWLRKASSPKKLTSPIPTVRERSLHEQFDRIGGGLTPRAVTDIMRQADAGRPQRLIDLMNESRQKDGHLQGTLGARDLSVAVLDLEFIEPPDATPEELKAVDLCRRIRDDFRNWPLLIQHLTSSYIPGHATSQIHWQKEGDGLVLPYRAEPIMPREFIFDREGKLRYQTEPFDLTGIDILEENPGQIVQLQRRIVGDVPVREGLMRLLCWSALLRNWDLREWLALGEIGWKPWRIGKYPSGQQDEDIDDFVRTMERIGSSGVAAIPDDHEIVPHWPKGQGPTNTSTHREFFREIGFEISKAVLGQTTSMEPGVNGARSSDEIRDLMRKDIREMEARDVAAALRYHIFIPAVAFNIGGNVRVAAPWFQTEDRVNQKDFSEAVKNLQEAGLRIPAQWVRDEVGMREPEGDEEVLEPKTVQVPAQLGPGQDPKDDPEEDPDTDPDPDDDEKQAAKRGSFARSLASRAPASENPGFISGQLYVDALTEHATKRAGEALEDDLAAITREIKAATSYPDLRDRLQRLYTAMSPELLSELAYRGIMLGELAGRLSVTQDSEGDP